MNPFWPKTLVFQVFGAIRPILGMFWSVPWSGPKVATFSNDFVRKWTLPARAEFLDFWVEPAFFSKIPRFLSQRSKEVSGYRHRCQECPYDHFVAEELWLVENIF